MKIVKECINNRFGLFYFSDSQRISLNDKITKENRLLKVEITKSEDLTGFVIRIINIMTSSLVETITSQRLHYDDIHKTNIEATTNNRQAVILWGTSPCVGIAYSNIKGYDILDNIFADEGDEFLLPSSESSLEFLNSSAHFIIERGYFPHDIWKRMRFCIIQYVLRNYPQDKNKITFVSKSEQNVKIDYSNEFNTYLFQTLEMVSDECETNARLMFEFQRANDFNQYNIYRHNVAMLSAVYTTLLHLL